MSGAAVSGKRPRLRARFASSGARLSERGPFGSVVSFPAGSSADIVAHIVAQALTERMGQSAVIDNKPGAGGNIGTDLVARAEAG